MLEKEVFFKLHDEAMHELDDLCASEMSDETVRKEQVEYTEKLADFYHYAFGGLPAEKLWELALLAHK